MSARPAEKAPMPVEVHEPPASPISLAQQFLSPVVNPLETTGIVLAVATCIEKLEFIDVLFGDRPPLTPPTNFYQRILADDPQEALQQAETLLKEMPLVEYYDSVALEGLKLARNAQPATLRNGRVRKRVVSQLPRE
ncbi:MULTISPECIES: hypothetical protein [Paraburkholderia]|uniref:Uncharacterized protein n=1 Tax=Paraburkholderia madseniana TaxID=2599607 RepID=A0AAP5BKM8_9BURK|nr:MULTISPECIES: hypothetical protein [Paraburkholderia]MCX4150310.1 hypothetical protein [Paraburkholderia madseniana]MDN7153243.1 hypothetical protein [Paraburkholderia sp. WS6]MDQ6412125.1 hypothetical protein [Paraburkholderia madseniana]